MAERWIPPDPRSAASERRPAPQRSLSLHLQQLLATLAGVVAAYLLTRHLQALPSTFLTALLLAGGSVASGRALAPWAWWGVMGAGCGALLGSAMVVGQKIQATDPQQGLGLRLALLGSLMVAGAIGGRSFSLDAAHPGRRPPKDTLRSASALTTGIFAALVTITFLHSGLDQARTVSSRLSTSLTILVLSLTGPGWLMHLLGSSWSKRGASEGGSTERSKG
jgi:hypothetical protein